MLKRTLRSAPRATAFAHRWSAGSVIKIVDGKAPHVFDFNQAGNSVAIKAGEGVIIRWDADKARKEPESESAKRLLQSKWNPKQHSDGAWAMAVRRLREVSHRNGTFPMYLGENFGVNACQ